MTKRNLHRNVAQAHFLVWVSTMKERPPSKRENVLPCKFGMFVCDCRANPRAAVARDCVQSRSPASRRSLSGVAARRDRHEVGPLNDRRCAAKTLSRNRVAPKRDSPPAACLRVAGAAALHFLSDDCWTLPCADYS